MTDDVCDFCGARNPHWIIPARDTEIGTIVTMGADKPIHTEQHFSAGDWAACSECVEFIRNDDRRGLRARCVETHMVKYTAISRSEMDILIGQVHHAFWSARTGEPEYEG
jgi:hypothetical protein